MMGICLLNRSSGDFVSKNVSVRVELANCSRKPEYIGMTDYIYFINYTFTKQK